MYLVEKEVKSSFLGKPNIPSRTGKKKKKSLQIYNGGIYVKWACRKI